MNSPEALTMSIQLVTAAEGYSVQGRGPSIAADLVALASVAIGARALTRAKGRTGTSNGRTGAVAAMAVGLTGVILAGVALAIADGGPGTGNGVVGSAFALVLGLFGMVLGGRARARSRRTGLSADGLAG
ncbi:DUF6223 family protein [Streptomyces coeruleorubidus]|uniref:DUF6223 family protein n=1 Tax=Streptomyces coeruleorubidus TaxID=116188 RepID=A0ABZ0KEK7_STRC4|nr:MULTISPECIES: DUF6223 family protein [Streptomyces]WOT36233.1 DUF6223 family protein [Streptomyces coeruleorubidus]GGT81224.1 hypothetical protein GCM10010244_01740 [Streptomyces bellus]